MVYVKMPNGTWVDVDDSVTPQRRAEIARKYGGDGKNAGQEFKSFTQTPEQKRDTVAAQSHGRQSVGERFLDAVTFGGAGMAFDAMRAGLDSTVGGKDWKQSYAAHRNASDEAKAQFQQDHPWIAPALDIAGGVASPVPKLGFAAKALGKAVPAVGRLLGGAGEAAQGAEGARGVVNALRNSQPVTAAAAGASAGLKQGAMQGAVEATDDLGRGRDNGGYIQRMTDRAGENALIGGAFGGGLGLVGSVGHAIADRMPKNAAHVAYKKVGDMLGRADVSSTSQVGPLGRVMDMSPQLTGLAARIAGNGNVARARNLASNAQTRLEDAAQRYSDFMGKFAPETGTSARALKASTTEARKAHGKAAWAEGESMDLPVKWSPELEAFTKSSDYAAMEARAKKFAEREGIPWTTSQVTTYPQSHVLSGHVSQRAVKVPTQRALDLVKREYDSAINSAMQANRSTANTEAAGLSNAVRRLKNLIGEANPEYADIMSKQRDAFEKIRSAEIGQKFVQDMAKDPRTLLESLGKAEAGGHLDAARTGILDHLLDVTHSTGNPSAKLAAIAKTPEQVAVLEKIFGGPRGLAKLKFFLKREERMATTDKRVLGAHSKQGTPIDDIDHNPAADVALGAASMGVRGAVTGGAEVGGHNIFRYLQNLNNKMTNPQMEEIAKLLSGKSEDLTAGIDASKKFYKDRHLRTDKQAEVAGKLANALVRN